MLVSYEVSNKYTTPSKIKISGRSNSKNSLGFVSGILFILMFYRDEI